jgi:cation diffusion facilitator family transporter
MPRAGSLDSYRHSHNFLGERHGRNERRTWIVVGLTAAMMLAEIVAGLAFGSMVLLADGIHMATHAGALGIAGVAYWFARRQVRNERFTFGTGKVGDLAAFSSAMILAGVAAAVTVESVRRLIDPVAIAYNDAIVIAALGLVVNLASAWLLRDEPGHGHGHAHGHSHAHADERAFREVGGHDRAYRLAPPHVVGDTHDRHGDHGRHGHDHAGHHHQDYNLRSAYTHVLADALTSLFAVGALVVARYFGWTWIDPVVGIVGALVVANWAYNLMRDAGLVLLDGAANPEISSGIRRILESDSDRIADLHVWRVGPGRYGAIISLVADTPHDPAYYKARLSELPTLAHVTVEVTQCPGPHPHRD